MSGRAHLEDLDDEIRDHLERIAGELVDAGMTPDAARAEARRRFGSVMLTKENTRAVWFPVWLEQLLQDLRGSLRQLRRTPGFSLVVVATLTLGIGLSTAIFSVVNAVLLQPLSYPHPERMIWIGTLDPRDSDEFATSVDVLAWREASSLEHIVGYDEYNGRVTDGTTRAPARIASVSEDFWSMAGARPEIGHLPDASQSAAVISRGYFERRFAGDASVIGRTVTVGGRQMPIVGVLPAGFQAELVLPTFSARLMPQPVDIYQQRPMLALPNGAIQIMRVIAQVKPSVSIGTARAELEAIRDRVTRERLNSMYRPILRVVPLEDRMVADVRPALLLLMAAVMVVLLVACTNIAALLLARASGRQRELAIRAAIGAGRGRMFRQLFAEALVFAAAGAALGIVVASAFVRMAVTLIPGAAPRLVEAGTDARVLLFALALALGSAFAFGLAPMLSAGQRCSFDLLKDGARPVSVATSRVQLRGWLVMSELALTVVLLCAAGLLVRSMWLLTTYPSGFAPEHVLTLTVGYDGAGAGGRERDGVRRRQYIHDVLEQLAAVPGVDAVGLTTDRSGRDRLFIENAAPVPDSERPVVLHSAVSSDFARAIGMRVLQGRWVTDTEPSPAYVVNETLARRVFGSSDPVGRRLQVDGPLGATEAEGAKFATIVGVVSDLGYSNLSRASEPEVFVDYAHAFPANMMFAARVSGDPRALAPRLRSLVTAVDPTQTVSEARTVASVLSDSVAPGRFTLILFVTFAGFALMLALIGVYGLVAYAVSLRTPEIGLRMALGASRRAVVWLMLRQGLWITVGGLVLGLLGAIAVLRVMTTLLYQTAAVDVPTFGVVSLALLITALAAGGVAALRAARVDPLVALRCD